MSLKNTMKKRENRNVDKEVAIEYHISRKLFGVSFVIICT